MVVGFVTSRCLKSGFGTHFGRLYGFNFQLWSLEEKTRSSNIVAFCPVNWTLDPRVATSIRDPRSGSIHARSGLSESHELIIVEVRGRTNFTNSIYPLVMSK